MSNEKNKKTTNKSTKKNTNTKTTKTNKKSTKDNKSNKKGNKASFISSAILILIGILGGGAYLVYAKFNNTPNNNKKIDDSNSETTKVENSKLENSKKEAKEELSNVTFYELMKDDQSVESVKTKAEKAINSAKTVEDVEKAKNEGIKALNKAIVEKGNALSADEVITFKGKVVAELEKKLIPEDSTAYSKESIDAFNAEMNQRIEKAKLCNDFSSLYEEISAPMKTKLVGASDRISFHFPYLASNKTGDCVFVKAGDTDILIDAGSEQKGAKKIREYLIDNKLVTDNKLEYVICTHAHTDHMAGFTGDDGIYRSFDIGHIIDFGYFGDDKHGYALNNFDSIEEVNKSDTLKTKISDRSVYSRYLKNRTYAVEKGAKHTTVYDYFTKNKGAKTWDITVGNNLTMSIMYQYFYDHPNTAKSIDGLNDYTPGEKHKDFRLSNFSDQNDFSVFTMFNQANKRYALFTGDGETYSEYSLVKEHNLPKVDLFKAGHHGSFTASTKFLLDTIQPKTAVACCVCGNMEYAKNPAHSFPAQEFIDRIAKYTDRVYAPTQGKWGEENKKFEAPLNGHIVITYDENGEEIFECSNNTLKMKDTVWFKENRKCPVEWEEEQK